MNSILQKNFIKYLTTILPIFTSIIYKNEVTIIISIKKLFPILFFLKNHTQTQFKILSDLVVIDYPQKKSRFEVVYNLLSIRYNTRLKVKLNINEYQKIPSIVSIYKISGWLEREAWDMFGIFFNNHPDLRRILTDYGFEGHPLRKDFPLSGFLEVYYSELKKQVVYRPVNLAQQYKTFEFKTPWK
jgi:NADH dehydrogenase (ubiquinone) Fe-S protein 3